MNKSSERAERVFRWFFQEEGNEMTPEVMGYWVRRQPRQEYPALYAELARGDDPNGEREFYGLTVLEEVQPELVEYRREFNGVCYSEQDARAAWELIVGVWHKEAERRGR
jgi:hypothetical protein